MKYWQLTAPKTFVKGQTVETQIQEGSALIKISRVSFSSSDINIYAGNAKVDFPLIPGRHSTGIISETAENNFGLQRGNRVLVDSYIPCNKCTSCQSGKTFECRAPKYMGISADGMMRDFAVVPLSSLYQIPGHLNDNTALFVEHTALALKAFLDLGLEKGQYVGVVSSSILGILFAQIAMYYQTIPIVIDHNPHNLQLLKELGVCFTINSQQQNPAEEVTKITGGQKCNAVAFMTVGHTTFNNVFDYTEFGGKIALVGWPALSENLSGNAGIILKNQLKVSGIGLSAKQIPAAINLLANKNILIDSLITKEIGFDEVPDAYSEFNNSSYYNKIVVKF